MLMRYEALPGLCNGASFHNNRSQGRKRRWFLRGQTAMLRHGDVKGGAPTLLSRQRNNHLGYTPSQSLQSARAPHTLYKSALGSAHCVVG